MTEPARAGLAEEARSAILAWYDAGGRTLAFRGTRDPYAVLVSEVMAQQTQIDRVADRWAAFLDAFPTIGALANTAPADVLLAWAGLGYNRRALNLWRAARLIVERHDGRIPSDPVVLAELPGIGPYTARAVSAIAFGRAVGPVDTNVRRVLGRLVFGADTADRKAIQAVADAIVPGDRPADWTHAVMDVGATFCRARPRCEGCPVIAWCRYASDRTVGTGERTQRPRARVGTPFHRTNRWLRGRILAQARSAPGWTTFDRAIGDHNASVVRSAAEAMATEGFLELESAADGSLRARLPLG
jgi:A/G-specific adenine glycosylase